MLRAVQKALAMWKDPSNASGGVPKVLVGADMGSFEELGGAVSLLGGLGLAGGSGGAWN